MSGVRVSDAEVRRIWADRSVKLAQAAAHLGISEDAIRARAQVLGLPDRRASAVPADAIRAAWADLSVTDAVAAARLGLSRSNLWRQAKALGLPPRPRKQRKLRDPALFAAMWEGGVSLAEMAVVFGLHWQTVSATAKAMGLARRKAGGPQRAVLVAEFRAGLIERVVARRMAVVAGETRAAMLLSEMVDGLRGAQRRAA